MSSTTGVWVLVELNEEKLQDGSLELVSHAHEIARKTGQELTAVVLDELSGDMVQHLARYGASCILSIGILILYLSSSTESFFSEVIKTFAYFENSFTAFIFISKYKPV